MTKSQIDVVSALESVSRVAVMAICAAALWLLFTNQAFAANGSEFKELYDLVYGWSTGYLGKVISITFLIVGLGVGVVRGSIIAAVGALAAAICLLMAPSIIDGLFNISGA